MNCLSNGKTSEARWAFFYPICTKTNPLCDPTAGAWVAAVTMCGQGNVSPGNPAQTRGFNKQQFSNAFNK